MRRYPKKKHQARRARSLRYRVQDETFFLRKTPYISNGKRATVLI